MTWNRTDFDRLATLFDGACVRGCQPAYGALGPCDCPRVTYSGSKPEIREAPNGDTKPCPHSAQLACSRCGAIMSRDYEPGLCPDGPDSPENGGDMDEHDQAESACRVNGCTTCNGSGRVPNVDAEGVCGVCGGSGCEGHDKWKRMPNGSIQCLPSGDPGCYPCPGCNGSGRAPAKRYLHVADKYTDAPEWAREYHDRAYAQACRVADALGVPAAYYPRPSVGALRVVDYPPGAGTVEHKDFDLFTIVLWRSTPADLEWANEPQPSFDTCFARDRLSPGLHIGELGELVGLGPATPHRVPARSYGQQSLLYFAIPDHAARLHVSPHHICERGETCAAAGCTVGPITVGKWLADREARSRIAAGGYK